MPIDSPEIYSLKFGNLPSPHMDNGEDKNKCCFISISFVSSRSGQFFMHLVLQFILFFLFQTSKNKMETNFSHLEQN